jgi:hypothetical protein
LGHVSNKNKQQSSFFVGVALGSWVPLMKMGEKGNVRTAFNSWISCALQGNKVCTSQQESRQMFSVSLCLCFYFFFFFFFFFITSSQISSQFCFCISSSSSSTEELGSCKV